MKLDVTNLRKWNRIAGFYDLNDGKFELLKRTTRKNIEPWETMDYTHGIDQDYLEEFNQVRFGIETLGKGRGETVCYIESFNKPTALKCKKAIEKKFKSIIIDKWQISWGNNQSMDKGYEELTESRLDNKVFYCSTISKLLDYAKVLGNIRFIYDITIHKFIIGKAEYKTHIWLFSKAIEDGKYGNQFEYYDDEDKDEYYSGNIEGPELTGAIIMKNATRNPEADCPDSTNVIYEYSTFYLCNGIWFRDKISQELNETPKQIY